MAKVSRAIVLANSKKKVALAVKKDVEKFLSFSGVRICKAHEKPQLVVSVGGDGTVLFRKEHYGTPFFAIGSATSFLCQSSFSDWKPRLSKALKRLRSEKRLLLECRLDGKLLPLSLNEIGIRNPLPRVLSIHLYSQGKHFAFRADGVLFSTPTGSPAYCYSCGGRQMAPSGNCYQAVAISPFRRLFSFKVFPAKSFCTLRISGSEKAQLFIDGQQFGRFTSKNTLTVKGSRKSFLFVKV